MPENNLVTEIAEEDKKLLNDLREIPCCVNCKSSHVYFRNNKRNYRCLDCGKVMKLVSKKITDFKPRTARGKTLGMEVMKAEELLTKLKTISNRRDKAFIAFLFLLGARISEIIGLKTKEGNYLYEPIKKKQLEMKDINGIKFLIVFNVVTLKRRKEFIKRTLPIRLDMDKEFIKLVVDEIQPLMPDDYLFEFNRQRGWQIVKKYFPNFYPHYFRHCRNTDLRLRYKLHDALLQRWNGWASMEMASYYSHLDWEDIARSMT